eukprot:g11324.t1
MGDADSPDGWGRQATLQAPLKQFLLQLLDAAYFDLEPDGSGQLRLRVPSVIPALPPEPHQELIEVPSRRDRSRSTQEAELSKARVLDACWRRARCRCKVPLPDVYGSAQFGVWVLA